MTDEQLEQAIKDLNEAQDSYGWQSFGETDTLRIGMLSGYTLGLKAAMNYLEHLKNELVSNPDILRWDWPKTVRNP